MSAHDDSASPDPHLVPLAVPLDRAGVERRLVAGLHRGEVAEVAADLVSLDPGALRPEARALAREVLDTCRRVAAAAADERTRVVAALGRLGIGIVDDRGPTRPLTPARHPDACQLATFDLAVDRRHDLAAVDVLAGLGYRPWQERSRGALRSQLRTHGALGLIRDADGGRRGTPATRLTLHVGGRSAASRLPARVAGALRPTDADHASVALPAPAWPLYSVIAPARRIAGRLRGRRAAPVPAAPVLAAPFLGTPLELVPALLELTGVGSDDLLVDLGCGDGRVLVAAATTVGCRGVGVERDSALVAAARARSGAAGVGDRVRIVHGDALDLDLREATAVFLFLPPAAVRSVLPRVLDRLSPGGVVLAHEQLELDAGIAPDRTRLVVADRAITAASIWRAGR